jgi:hypothetical protein
MRAFFLVPLLLLIAACAAPVKDGAGSPATTVYQAKLAYAAVLTGAVEYNALPRCDRPTSPPLCSSQSAVEAMRKANLAARSTLDSAEKTARDPAVKGDTLALAATAAVNAVDSFKTVVALYKR